MDKDISKDFQYFVLCKSKNMKKSFNIEKCYELGESIIERAPKDYLHYDALVKAVSYSVGRLRAEQIYYNLIKNPKATEKDVISNNAIISLKLIPAEENAWNQLQILQSVDPAGHALMKKEIEKNKDNIFHNGFMIIAVIFSFLIIKFLLGSNFKKQKIKAQLVHLSLDELAALVDKDIDASYNDMKFSGIKDTIKETLMIKKVDGTYLDLNEKVIVGRVYANAHLLDKASKLKASGYSSESLTVIEEFRKIIEN